MTFHLSSAQRSAAAKRAAATMKAEGKKVGFARMTHAQRVLAAKKAAQTRKAEGVKPFAHRRSVTNAPAKSTTPVRTVTAHNSALKQTASTAKLTVSASQRKYKIPIHVHKSSPTNFEHARKRRAF